MASLTIPAPAPAPAPAPTPDPGPVLVFDGGCPFCRHFAEVSELGTTEKAKSIAAQLVSGIEIR
jgi:predicted DCC family thiol-disulfide oxidoreductase YuxK